MRSPFRRSVVLAVLLAIVASGCGPSEAGPSSSTDGDPAATAIARASGAAQGDPLSAFEGRLRDATTAQGIIVRALAAASAGSTAQVDAAVGQMRTWVAAEQAWLKAHPAQTCFAAAATRYSAAVEAMATSAGQFEAAAHASPAASDDAAGAAAAQSLQDASRALLDAAALAKTSRPNCR